MNQSIGRDARTEALDREREAAFELNVVCHKIESGKLSLEGLTAEDVKWYMWHAPKSDVSLDEVREVVRVRLAERAAFAHDANQAVVAWWDDVKARAVTALVRASLPVPFEETDAFRLHVARLVAKAHRHFSDVQRDEVARAVYDVRKRQRERAAKVDQDARAAVTRIWGGA